MEKVKEEIKVLLDKFSQGKTSSDEEKTIRIYLRLKNKDPEHHKLRKEFKRIAEKKQITTTANSDIKDLFQNIQPQKIALFTLFLAILLCAIFYLSTNKEQYTDESFALIEGNRIEEREYIEKYVQKKLKKTQLFLSDCLTPLENIKSIKLGFDKEYEALRLIQKSFNTTDKSSSTKQEEYEKNNDNTTASDTIKQQSTQPNTEVPIQQIQQ